MIVSNVLYRAKWCSAFHGDMWVNCVVYSLFNNYALAGRHGHVRHRGRMEGVRPRGAPGRHVLRHMVVQPRQQLGMTMELMLGSFAFIFDN